MDETCFSNGDVYTILTNKAAKGRKGALVAMVRGVSTDTVSSILCKLPHKKRLSVGHDAYGEKKFSCCQTDK